MTKEQRYIVAECVRQISDDDIRWLGLRLTEKLGGDLAEAVDFLSKSDKLDAYLKSATNSNELFEAIDRIKDIVVGECKKRGVALKWMPIA